LGLPGRLTNYCPSVLCHCWLGHLAHKSRPQYDLYCVWWDVKPYSTLLYLINVSELVLTAYVDVLIDTAAVQTCLRRRCATATMTRNASSVPTLVLRSCFDHVVTGPSVSHAVSA